MKEKIIGKNERASKCPSVNKNRYPNFNILLGVNGFSKLDLDRLIFDLDTHRRLHPCTIKLFGAYSLDIDPKYGEYRINWYFSNRKEPLAPYEDLIYGYEGKCYSEYAIKEWFTGNEIELLREYLKRAYGSELHVQEVDLPIPNFIMGCSDTIGYWENGERIEGQIYLSKDEGYSLPFEVCGYYNLRDGV